MTYDEMNDRLKENLKEQKEIVSSYIGLGSGDPISEEDNTKMVALMDEFDELWEKVKTPSSV